MCKLKEVYVDDFISGLVSLLELLDIQRRERILFNIVYINSLFECEM